MPKLQALCKILKVARNASATKLFISKQPRIDKNSSMQSSKNIHSKNFQFYCSNLATPQFATISALLAKFLLKALKK